jgi:hypothetical protein
VRRDRVCYLGPSRMLRGSGGLGECGPDGMVGGSVLGRLGALEMLRGVGLRGLL